MANRGKAARLALFALLSLRAALARGEAPLVLTNCSLIDGTGREPIRDARVVVACGRIAAAGKAFDVPEPAGADRLDLRGATVLPGFINAHVHYAFDAARLESWAAAGVTSVRDMASLGTPLDEVLRWRAESRARPELSRVFTVGPMIAAPGGYGSLFVSTAGEARQAVHSLVEAGVDAIKFSLEDGYAGRSGLPKLGEAELAALIGAARAQGARTTAHITQARYLRQAVRAGADEIAHIAYDPVDAETWRTAASRGVILVPTFTVFRNYGAPVSSCIANLAAFLAAGGAVATGNDYGGGPGDFEGGMPMYEFACMEAAGMSAMQIIVASTRNAALCCGAEDELGTIEPGKLADILVVAGDPLEDLDALREPLLVLKGGAVVGSGPRR